MKKKTAILTARLTPAEKAAIERRAKHANMTVTDYIVKCALGKNVRQIDELPPRFIRAKGSGAKPQPADETGQHGAYHPGGCREFTEAYTNLYGLIEEIYWEGE